MLDWYVLQAIDRHSELARECERRYWIKEALSQGEPPTAGTLARFENRLGVMLIALGKILQRQSGLEQPVQNSPSATVAGIRPLGPHGISFTLTGPAGDTMVKM